MTDRQNWPAWRTVTLYAVTITGVVLCVAFMHALLFPITGAVAFAIVLQAPLRHLRRRFGPALSATILLVALSVAVILPCVFLVRTLIHEAMQTTRYVASGAASDDIHRYAALHHKIGPWLERGLDQLAPDQEGRAIATKCATWIGLGFRSFVAGIVRVVLMLFLLFFLLRDSDRAHGTLLSFLPLPDSEAKPFLKRLGEVTEAIFVGRFLIAGIQGLLSGLAYLALGVPGALLWGTLTAVLCLVPAFGAFLVWVPIALYLGLAATWTKALILALWGGIVISNLDNLLYPALVGSRTNLPTPIIFISIFGGLAVFGFSGFILGPVTVAATMLLLQSWKERK